MTNERARWRAHTDDGETVTDLVTLLGWIAAGQLTRQTGVKAPGVERWVPAGEIPELRAAFAAAPPPPLPAVHASRVVDDPPPVRGIVYVDGQPLRVTVADFNMPFSSMVGFMVKWAFASIPAIIIIVITIAVAMTLLGGLLGGLASQAR